MYGAEVFERSDEGACTDSQLVVPLPAVVGIAVGALALGAGAVAAGRVLRRRRRPGR